MMVFKRNQIVILSLILVILVAGYLQYSYKRGSTSASGNTGRLGEAVYVDNQSVTDSDTAANASGANSLAAKNTTGSAAVVSPDEDVSKTAAADDKKAASNSSSDYFAQAKLDKELSRSKSTDSLKAIAEDQTADSQVRATANEQRMKLIQNSEKEARIESLIKEKNFDDVVVLFADDGSLDIVVKASELSASQATQIADIASRQAKVAMTDIHVRSYN